MSYKVQYSHTVHINSTGPTAIDFKEYSNYYFEVGLIICKLTRDKDLQRTLRIAFSGERYKTLLVRSLCQWENINHFCLCTDLLHLQLKLARRLLRIHPKTYENRKRAFSCRLILIPSCYVCSTFLCIPGYHAMQDVHRWRAREASILKLSGILGKKRDSSVALIASASNAIKK